jgi:hypothetical protein
MAKNFLMTRERAFLIPIKNPQFRHVLIRGILRVIIKDVFQRHGSAMETMTVSITRMKNKTVLNPLVAQENLSVRAVDVFRSGLSVIQIMIAVIILMKRVV